MVRTRPARVYQMEAPLIPLEHCERTTRSKQAGQVPGNGRCLGRLS
jgi:hypothetical protein